MFWMKLLLFENVVQYVCGWNCEGFKVKCFSKRKKHQTINYDIVYNFFSNRPFHVTIRHC